MGGIYAKIHPPIEAVIKKILTISALIFISGIFALGVIFPSRYSNLIDKYSKENSLSPSLVRSVIWAESRYDKKALSSKGAMGLMQIIPSTFNMLAIRAGLSNADPFDPETSIKLGCMYLRELTDYYNGNTDKAIMAYNAGPGNVNKWTQPSDIFAETEKYLKKIKLVNKYYRFFGQ